MQVRLVEETSIMRKRFRKVIDTPRRVVLRTVHPLFVLRDLRKGSLESLDRYLAQNRGIPDRAVALELRKLLSGSRFRTPHRLILVEHPDGPKSKGGRPKQGLRKCSRVEVEVARAFEELRRHGPSDSAAVEVAAKFKIRRSTVYKYAKLVADYDSAMRQAELERLEREADFRHFLERREKALRIGE